MPLKPYQKIIIVIVMASAILACNAINQVLVKTPVVQGDNATTSGSTPYNEKAVPQDEIEAALRDAKADGKLVLLDFGANWCPDCLVLSKLFEDPSVQPYLQEHFYVVHIDVGYWDKNLNTAEKYGNPIEKGIPAVVILSADGETLASTKDGALANARTATAQEILEYLKTWVAKKP